MPLYLLLNLYAGCTSFLGCASRLCDCCSGFFKLPLGYGNTASLLGMRRKVACSSEKMWLRDLWYAGSSCSWRRGGRRRLGHPRLEVFVCHAQPEDVRGLQHSSFLVAALSGRNPPSPCYWRWDFGRPREKFIWAVECRPDNIDRRVSGQPCGIMIFHCDPVLARHSGKVDLVSRVLGPGGYGRTLNS